MGGSKEHTHAAAIFMAITLLALVMTGSGSATEKWQGTMLSNLNLRESPDPNAPVIKLLHKGDTVSIIQVQNTWYQIVLENDSFGFKGWASAEFIEKKEKSADQETFGKNLGQAEAQSEVETKPAPAPVKPPAAPAPAVVAPAVAATPEPRQPIEVKLPPTFFAAVSDLERIAKELDKWDSKEMTVTEEVVDMAPENSNTRPPNRFPVTIIVAILGCLVLLFTFATIQFSRINRTVQVQLNSIKGYLDEVKVNLKGGPFSRNLKDALVEANFVIRNRAYGGFIHNISPGGAFIETRESFSISEKVTLTYQDPQTHKNVKKNGEIVRIDPKGIAIQFDTYSGI